MFSGKACCSRPFIQPSTYTCIPEGESSLYKGIRKFIFTRKEAPYVSCFAKSYSNLMEFIL